MLLWVEAPTREVKHHRVRALQVRETPPGSILVGQLIVGERAPNLDVAAICGLLSSDSVEHRPYGSTRSPRIAPGRSTVRVRLLHTPLIAGDAWRPPRQPLGARPSAALLSASVASATASSTGDERPLDRSTILALAAMGIAVLIIANDFSALTVALPAIEKEFDTDVCTVQWVINAYALTFGVLIVAAGACRHLRAQRIFLIGTAIFAGFSLLGAPPRTRAGLSPAAPYGHRRRDDVAGDPRHYLRGPPGEPRRPGRWADPRRRRDRERDRADGRRPLTAAAPWRWIFFVNVPIAAFGALVTWLAIHQTEPQQSDRRIDYSGVASLSLGLVSCWSHWIR